MSYIWNMFHLYMSMLWESAEFLILKKEGGRQQKEGEELNSPVDFSLLGLGNDN